MAEGRASGGASYFLLNLTVYPAIYARWRERSLDAGSGDAPHGQRAPAS